MPNEDKADIPGGWRDVVHPRRHGMIAVEPARDSDEGGDFQTRIAARPLLYRLVRHGWHWGPAGQQARRDQLFRPFGAEGRLVLTVDPGVSAVLDAKAEPEQTITELTFESSKGDLGVFSDLPLVTRSELIRSLRSLG
jgi:hypothetical protein